MKWPEDITDLPRLHRQLRGLASESRDTERILAEALGYQQDAIDDPHSPCPGEFITGDHTVITLAMEAAHVIKASRVVLPRAQVIEWTGGGGKRAVFGPVTAVLTADGRMTIGDLCFPNIQAARETAAGLLAAAAWLEAGW